VLLFLCLLRRADFVFVFHLGSTNKNDSDASKRKRSQKSVSPNARQTESANGNSSSDYELVPREPKSVKPVQVRRVVSIGDAAPDVVICEASDFRTTEHLPDTPRATLQNPGYFCYANATLQALANLTSLVYWSRSQ
jgi:hypothetical protein